MKENENNHLNIRCSVCEKITESRVDITSHSLKEDTCKTCGHFGISCEVGINAFCVVCGNLTYAKGSKQLFPYQPEKSLS